ncbi:hypothetical protein D9757_014177 [Collybiopsis confluens]|uniref:C2H2-type domain-containing protein n=1 Tax=Collybiopsis confluens TaxID=2823264 RepID=A0A8H5CKR9_9AGAR|nr:hypothetical protein D9757_014177 [Collybiopsis confluens]
MVNLLLEGHLSEVDWSGSGQVENLGSPETHFTYGVAASLSPIGYQLDLSLPQSTISPRIDSPVYDFSSSHSSSSAGRPTSQQNMLWNHSVPGNGIASGLNSPRRALCIIPMRYRDHLHSPTTAISPLPNLALLAPEQTTFYPSASAVHYNGNSSSVYGEPSSNQQYVSLSDVATLSSYHSPLDIEFGRRLSDVSRVLIPKDEENSFTSNTRGRRGKKRARDQVDDSLSETTTPAAAVPPKRPRGRPRKYPPPVDSAPVVTSMSYPSPAHSEAEPKLPAIKREFDIGYGESSEAEDDGDDSDLYIPSRSGSPRALRRSRDGRRLSEVSLATSSSGGGTRRRPNGTGAASHLRRLEKMLASTSAPTGIDGRRRNPVVPEPNVIKKSRGRKVPVDVNVAVSGGAGGAEPELPDVKLSLNGIVGGDDGGGPDDLSAQGLYVFPDDGERAAAAVGWPGQDAGGAPSQVESLVDNMLYDALDMSPPKAGRPGADSVSTRYSVGDSSSSAKAVSGGIRKATGERKYVCTAAGCGKCFVRGEHLKRHVRSLHTWDKHWRIIKTLHSRPSLSPSKV